MARRRMIDPNFWVSEDVSKLTYVERIMLIGMFSNADDFGKGRANPVYLRSTIFPYDDISNDEMRKMLQSISKSSNIVIYSIDDCEYYKFINWEKWQTVQKPQKSKIPEPVENDSRMIPELVENDSGLKERKGKERKGKEERGKEEPLTFGEFNNLVFPDDEMSKITSVYEQPQKLIDKISRIVKNSKKIYESHYALLLKIAEEDNWPKKRKPPDKPAFTGKYEPMPDEIKAKMGFLKKVGG